MKFAKVGIICLLMLKAAHNNNTLNPFLFISGPSCPCCVQASISLKCLKGTVSPDFLLLAFFRESTSPKPQIIHSIRVISNLFGVIFASQGTPPASMTQAANFAAGTAEGVDIRGKLPPYL